MLTRDITGEGERQLTNRWWLVLGIVGVLFAAVIVPTVISTTFVLPSLGGVATQTIAGPEELGRGFVNEFLIQFQVAGVLLTVALIGAIVIAFEERGRRRRVLTLAEEHELRKRVAERERKANPSTSESAPAAPAAAEPE
jgi:NADH-quinone oxidoreductase subunit J